MNSFFSQYINYILQKRWLSHVIFWGFLLVFYTLELSSIYDTIYKSFCRNLILLIPQIIASYFCIYYLLPKFLYKKKYIIFSLIFILSTYIFSFMARVMVVHVVELLFREPPFRQESLLEIALDIKRLYQEFFHTVYLPVFILANVKFVKELFSEKSKRELLEKEKLKAELNFMKAQIHPHFLFNTLNNLYVLTIEKSDNAPETVLKLSEMLDYMLYKCSEERVSIGQEIQLIKNYIDLERLRYGDRLVLEFEEKIDNANSKIAPLILISFVENAFKHGVSGNFSTPKIKIEINILKNQLQFSVFNTKPERVQKDETKFKQGIGLRNTKNQLQSIYPESHSMKIMDNESSYMVELQVNLNA